MGSPLSSTRFLPPRKQGLTFHFAVGAGLAVAAGVLFYLAIQEQYGAFFVLFLLVSLLLLIPLVVVVYRGYALMQASYTLDRDGLRLRWGLRSEDIPLPEIEWVRPAADLAGGLPLPLLSQPGALLGVRQVAGLGTVEFMASTTETLLLVATQKQIYAVSPEDPLGFIRSFQYVMEMGSLTPIASASSEPAVFVRQVLGDSTSRLLIGLGLGVALALLVVVSLSVPGRISVSLGYTPQGLPQDPVPSNYLLLLPIGNMALYFADLLLGLYLYRHQKIPIAYMLWIASMVTSLLLMVAVVVIL